MAADNEGWGEWGRYVLEELKRLNKSLSNLGGDLSALRKEREGKVSALEVGVEKRLRDAEREIGEIKMDIGKLQERLKVITVIQGAFTTVATAVAAWLGVRR